MRFPRYLVLAGWPIILIASDWYSEIYAISGLHFLFLTAYLLNTALYSILALFNIYLLFTRQKRTALIRLGIIVVSIVLIFEGIQIRPAVTKWGIEWRVRHEAKFQECSKNAKAIVGSHKFNMCEETDIGVTPGSTNVVQIVYDPDMLAVNGAEDKKLWNATKIELGIQNFRAENLGNGFYLLKACGNAMDIACEKLK